MTALCRRWETQAKAKMMTTPAMTHTEASKFASGHNPAGEPWPSLPAAGGGVWSAAAFIRALRPTAAWSAISQSSNGRLGESPCAPHVALSSSETAPAEVTQQAVGNMSTRS